MTEGLWMRDKEEMMLSWCFTKEIIENSPSRRDGISANLEVQARSDYCNFIRWMCSQFKLDIVPTATALMFCHRFYSHQSLAKNDWKTIATACVFLASKSEDSYRSLDDIVRIAFGDDAQKLPNNSQQKEFLQKKRELIDMAISESGKYRREFLQKKRELIDTAERVLLTTLRFDTNVTHPYRPLHNAMKVLGINTRELRREVWKLVGCWLDTTLCLQHKPEYIAAASLHVVSKLHDLKLPDVRGISLWSEKFAPERLDACIGEMVQVLCTRRWPNCAKLTNRPQSKPEPEPEPEPESKLDQATAIQKLPEQEEEPEKNNPKLDTPDSVLALAKQASKKREAVPKRDTLVLDSSSFSAPGTKLEEICKGLDKVYVARIREVIRKRKNTTAESRPTVGKVQLDASSEGLDDWIERELESGIIVESKPVSDKKKAILLDTSSEDDDDLWIEKELEEGIIVGSNKMKSTGKCCAALKLEKSSTSKAWRGQKREMEAGFDLSSKRQRY